MRATFYLLKILISSTNFTHTRLLSDILCTIGTQNATIYKRRIKLIIFSSMRAVSGSKFPAERFDLVHNPRILPEIIVRCIQPCKLTKAIPRRR